MCSGCYKSRFFLIQYWGVCFSKRMVPVLLSVNHFNPLTTANMNVVANLTKQYKNDIVSYRQLLSFSKTQEH